MTAAPAVIACKSPAEIEHWGNSLVDPGDRIVINPEDHD